MKTIRNYIQSSNENETYHNLLLHNQWIEKRAEIITRDGYKCRVCKSQNSLQVHHRQYHINNKTGIKVKPWQYDNKYLITLCKYCHELGHKHFTIQTFHI